ncbi:MAG: WD domain, G-beta repeat [Methanosaeta sp. PtaB.Bin018]|nr:MAG: WD domain, G-beta repeat [Methanosaeta sp. PtaB.Bin018]
MGDDSADQWRRADEEVRKNLPPGVKLIRTLRGHTDYVGRIAWSPDGRMLASPSADGTVGLWDTESGSLIRKFKGHGIVYSAAFDITGRLLASGGVGKPGIILWNIRTGQILRSLNFGATCCVAFDRKGEKFAGTGSDGMLHLIDIKSGQVCHTRVGATTPIQSFGSTERYLMGGWIKSISFDPSGNFIACGDENRAVSLWDVSTNCLWERKGQHTGDVVSVAFDPDGTAIFSASQDRTIREWTTGEGKLLRTIEGHTGSIQCLGLSADRLLIASKAGKGDNTIRIWNRQTGREIAAIPEPGSKFWAPGLAFHPHMHYLATVGSDPGTPEDDPFGKKTLRDRVIHILKLDYDALLAQFATSTVAYTSSKIVLVGDSGVGKTCLGWRLAHGNYKEHSSTHGQQFWLLKQLSKQRNDGAQCEAVLWDLAGQDDYRLTNLLFLDDADMTLMLFDPTRIDTLSGVEFWLKQLNVGASPFGEMQTMLIAAGSDFDRGTPQLTQKELDAFCKQHSISTYLPTSAKYGEGIEELIQQMQARIQWNDKPATITTETFKQIKDFVLNLKEDSRRLEVILTPEELRQRLEKTDHTWKFSDDEMLTAIGHLANHGYVTRLKTSQGELRILLAPELLNNLAASFVLEARRNQKGLGSLEEQKLLSSEYTFPELEKLTEAEKDVLIDSTVVLFLEHNISFRQIDPLNGRAYLVFPELINLKKPLIKDDAPTEEGAAYTVSGAVENVYASLVVLMGYTQTFTRTSQWRDHARYEVWTGHVCGFRQEAERYGELDFVLYFGVNTPASVRTLFQSLFENFLERHNLTVRRYDPVVCSKGHTLNRAIVRQKMSSRVEFAFCSDCGEKIMLPKADQTIHFTKRQAEEVEANHWAADQRSQFEQVLFRLKNYVTEQKIAVPDCFISYAWGNPEHERWVERSLATDLQKAGIIVVLDRWENARIGASVPRFVERVGKTDRVIVVGTPLYRKKYDNNEPMRSFVVAAEEDIIGKRMIGTEAGKECILPVLLEGTEESAFPYLLQGRVHADFRKSEDYFNAAFDLLLSLYQIPPQCRVAMKLRESLVSQRQ